MTTKQLELPARLWSVPDGPWPNPPVQTRPALLPVGELTPENTERLFTRLLETEAHIEHAALYGLPGQAQAGIDVYARTAPSLDAATAGRDFAALQSRRVKHLTAASISSAVTDFLAGEWADRCSRFYYATSSSLRDIKLDAAVQSAHDTLSEKGIKFVPWGAEEIADRLRDHPRLVDDFFGRAWVTAFCGEAHAVELARRIAPEQARKARGALGSLYRAAFRAQGASATVTGMNTQGLPYLVLDTQPASEDSPLRATAIEPERPEPAVSTKPREEYAGTPRRMRRRTRRLTLRDPLVSADAERARTPVDEWMESARLRLLIGAPGSGKSSFLMFTAADILAAEPQSAALQRAHGGDLPLWLPFGFLCRHLDGSTTNSVVSAIEAWVTQQGGPTAWDLTQPALDDERAVLLVDGIDEWNDPASGEYALGLIESFVSQRRIGAILTARPYAVDRLNWVGPWAKAVLAPLTYTQQVDLVVRVLSESDTIGADGLSSPHAESFLAELTQIPALSPLLGTPLFLGLLAKSWRGESLPPQRFHLFSALVQLLVDKHPQMRRRASSAAGSEFSTGDMLTALRGVAYQARVEGGSSILPRQEMERRFREELRRDDGLAYPAGDAARVATAVLSQAEDEYGLLVPQGVGMVGFLHRVLLDQLAGEHLATLSPEVQESILTARAGDRTWRDVLIAGLATQVNAHVNASLLTRLGDHAEVNPVDKYELIADAIAADVAITTTKQLQWMSEIIERVDEHADTNHRATLIESLVAMTKHASLRPLLLGTFRRWLNSAHPEPTSTLWTLRDAAIAETGVLPALLWGLRHEEEAVQLNAAHAIAIRYGGDPTVGARIETSVRDGASAIDQAFALLCLGTGWPEWAQLPALLKWARTQVTPELRVCALHLLRHTTEGEFGHLSAAEKRWFGGFLRHEGLRPREHWKDLAIPFIQNVLSEQPEASRFVLETLSGNGKNGGDRSIAWMLACTTFSGDDEIKNWVAGELEHPDRNGLLLHNLALIPESWRADPAFARSAAVTVRKDASGPQFSDGTVAIADSLPDEEALEALLPMLDSWRPVRAGAVLLERFGDRPEVRAVFDERLHGTLESAAPLAPLALEALGKVEGFRVLVELLRSSVDADDSEARVLVAMAVANAWARFASTAEDPAAAAILGDYDPDELATRCTAVGTGTLTWHVDAIIAAWPAHEAVATFALQILQHPRHLSIGIHDPAPAAIARAYGGRADATANMMMDAVLDQVAYLPPQLREALVDALSRSDLTPATLRGLLEYSSEDPDSWVQRASLIGLIRRVQRYQISPNAEHAQAEDVTEWLRAQVQAELCGYGPALEHRRQTGWVGMLLLDDLGLHDDLLETIGEPTRPGVRLRHLFGGVDRELIDLLNVNWNKVTDHFGDDLFTLLSASHARDVRDDARATVLGQLSSNSSPHTSISKLIRAEADSNPQFRNSPAYLLWLHRGGRRDLDLFLACLTSASSASSTRGGTNEVYDVLVDQGSWQIPADTLRDALTRQPGFDSDPELRAIFCELFPLDEGSRAMFADLEEWFRAGDHRERREWIDVLAVAVRSSPPKLLPVIIERAHQQIMIRDSVDLLPLLTGPLLRRLRHDTDAVRAIRVAIQDPGFADADTPIWAPAPTDGHLRNPAGDTQLCFLLAAALDHAGVLDEHTATIAQEVLTTSNPDVVVHDPFTGAERAARAAAVSLTRHSPTRD
ncbi:NACHT domain-containing protein [Curtobacterium flaccumfaciens pv. flaccumfaciens]|uniref:NACHT domain-containing protein n=1 Tax=Curtobacterium flaccumfaciens TaxID=2035 RepID=UPI003AB41C4C